MPALSSSRASPHEFDNARKTAQNKCRVKIIGPGLIVRHRHRPRNHLRAGGARRNARRARPTSQRFGSPVNEPTMASVSAASKLALKTRVLVDRRITETDFVVGLFRLVEIAQDEIASAAGDGRYSASCKVPRAASMKARAAKAVGTIVGRAARREERASLPVKIVAPGCAAEAVELHFDQTMKERASVSLILLPSASFAFAAGQPRGCPAGTPPPALQKKASLPFGVRFGRRAQTARAAFFADAKVEW